MALGRPRSSLLRSGVALHTAVWDAGYRGRSQSLLTVHHPEGFRLQRDARLAQLVFFRLSNLPEQGLQLHRIKEGIMGKGCRHAVGFAVSVRCRTAPRILRGSFPNRRLGGVRHGDALHPGFCTGGADIQEEADPSRCPLAVPRT